ncbi:MAG: helix-turn-helix transcriptional regulator [Planctomycetota bacterium]|jgi:AraC-like DNA-binding protein|nr:helix-turn-helix transcriptional regulator [Planctomycetota bacterium]
MSEINPLAMIHQGLAKGGALRAVVEPSDPPKDATYNYHPKVMISVSGSHIVRHREGDLALRPGDFVIYRPGSWHVAVPRGQRRYGSVIIAPDRIRVFGRRASGPMVGGDYRAVVRAREADVVLEHGLAALLASADHAVLAHLARAVLVQACRPALVHDEASTDAAWLRVRAHLETYVHQALSRASVAAACGMSPGHLSLLARRHTGRRLIEVLTEARMRHAEHLLRDRGMTVAGTAAALGYADLRHFRRVFKRALGVPPGVIGVRGSL